MEIDPLTGGYVYREPTKPDEEQNQIQKKLRPAEKFVRKDDLNPLYNPVPSSLSLDERFSIVRSVGEECIEDHELKNLLKRKAHPICYDGFEPSGRMHIAQVNPLESYSHSLIPVQTCVSFTDELWLVFSLGFCL